MPKNKIQQNNTTTGFVNETEELHNIIQILCSSLDLKKTLKAMSISILRVTNSNSCDVFLKEESRLRCVYSYGKKPPSNLAYDLSKAFYSKKVLESQEALKVSTAKSFSHYNEVLKSYFIEDDICCVFYLPLILKGKSAGFVKIYRKACVKAHSDNIKQAITLTNQLALAIDNSIMHDRLDNREGRWKSIFEDTSDGLILTDEFLNIRYVNRAFENIIGMKEKELKRKNIKIIFANENDKKLIEKEVQANLYNEKKKIHHELAIESKHHIITTSLNIAFTYNYAGTPRVIFSFEDITKQKELESSKNEFVSIASHELRSPLTAMNGFLNLMGKSEYGQLSSKQEYFLKRAVESTGKMINLVEHLLDVSKIDRGTMLFTFEPLNIKKIITSVKTDLKNKAKEKELKIITKGLDKSIFVMGDAERFYQIFFNLVDNAIKYSFPKSEIIINCRKSKDRVIISIKDNGVGITPTEQKKLFSKFTRINNPYTLSAGGTGLGLYIVKNLVLAHKGLIWIESKEKKGSIFFVEFKLAKQLSLLNQER